MSHHSAIVRPEELGLDPDRWNRVLHGAERLVAHGILPALSLQVRRRGLTTGVHHFGSRTLDAAEPLQENTLFLVASLTKPMVAMAALLLVERGRISLNDRVVSFIPEFREGPKKTITIRHLLTHTSGLPDMLPNNQELRMARSPLSAFIKGTCETELLFPPERGSQYQSMGFALLAGVIEAISGKSYQRFLREELFEPLGMMNSWLGVPDDFPDVHRIAEVEVPDAQAGGVDWNWNSRYWRSFGAPWGGAITTTSDMSRFCQCLAQGGEPLFSSATVREATTNRLLDFPGIPDGDRRSRGWGYGWRMNWKDHRSLFADLLPAEAYGHWGATGTLCWIDPERELSAVLLSTRAVEREVSPLTRLSNMICAAAR